MASLTPAREAQLDSTYGNRPEEAAQARASLLQLEEQLATRGKHLRDDSKLAWLVACSPEMRSNPEVISRTVDELDFIDNLHQHTCYPELVEHGLRIVAKHVRETTGLAWGDTWNLTRKYAVPAFKAKALEIAAARTQPNRDSPA